MSQNHHCSNWNFKYFSQIHIENLYSTTDTPVYVSYQNKTESFASCKWPLAGSLYTLPGGIKGLFKYWLLFEITFVLFWLRLDFEILCQFLFFTVACSIHNFTQNNCGRKAFQAIFFSSHRFHLSLRSVVQSLQYYQFVLNSIQSDFKSRLVIFFIWLLLLARVENQERKQIWFIQLCITKNEAETLAVSSSTMARCLMESGCQGRLGKSSQKPYSSYDGGYKTGFVPNIISLFFSFSRSLPTSSVLW